MTLTRRLAHDLRVVLRRALNLSRRGIEPPLHLATGPEGLWVRAGNRDAAVEYHQTGTYAPEESIVPLALLADCEGRSEEPVRIEILGDGRVLAGWQDGAVPRRGQYGVPSTTQDQEVPALSERFASNPPELLSALAEATRTTDPDSARFALGCLELRGNAGEVAATDGRQILLHAGFAFPWGGPILVPGSAVFACRELPQDQPVLVGKMDEWFVLRIRQWTLWRRINRDGRFPKIEDHLPPAEQATARLELAPADVDFLAKSLPRLPGDAEANLPVTVDLNGQVLIRGTAAGQPQPTELVLSQSRLSGEPIRLNTNRRYLARTLELGFREVHLFGPSAPVLCQGDGRRFVWALLDAESAIGPSPEAIRIASPAADSQPLVRHIPKRVKKKMSRSTSVPASRNNGASQKPPTEVAPAEGSTSALGQAIALRDSLRAAAGKAGSLVQALKQEKRQAKLLKSTLASLRQIQTLEV